VLIHRTAHVYQVIDRIVSASLLATGNDTAGTPGSTSTSAASSIKLNALSFGMGVGLVSIVGALFI
jgi:hypothetical protein